MNDMPDEGAQIGEVVAEERVTQDALEDHITAIMKAAQSDDSLSPEARALAMKQDLFEVDRGANTGFVEGALIYTFAVALGKGAASAAGALIVKELWAYVKTRLPRRDPTGIKDVTDKAARADPEDGR